jgi:membrane protease YdiL (CAAX protease family)
MYNISTHMLSTTLALLFLPFLASLSYSILWPGEPFVAMLYGAAKVLMVFLALVAYRRLRLSWRAMLPKVGWREVGVVVLLGLGTWAVTAAVLWWLTQAFVPLNTVALRTQVAAFGLDTPLAYVLFALGIAFIHSLFEEWYWRATAVHALTEYMSFSRAAFLGGLAFSGHHMVVLSLFTSWPWAVALGLVVGAAGWAWSWLAHWRGHFWWSWISHMGADLAIFLVGWFLLK